jgi:fatty acid desaturase
MVSRRVPAFIGAPALTVVAAARFRFLQEVGHTALHGALCRSRRWQWLLSDAFANGPLFRADSAHRFIAHVREHHMHVNELDGDPNIARFIRIGFVPGLTTRRFAIKLLHPLTPSGFGETVASSVKNATSNRSVFIAAVRVASVGCAVALFFWLGGAQGLLAGYVIPMLTIYPLFSWISLLVEHRWFVPDRLTDRRLRECTVGRPTEYPGLLGWALSRALFPASDRLHLAHSLHPALRWNHLAAVDRALRNADLQYTRYASVGLLKARALRPSALSDLRIRMTSASAADGWNAYLAAYQRNGSSTEQSLPKPSEAREHAAAQ